MAYSIQVKGIHGIEKYLESIPKAVEQASREAVAARFPEQLSRL